LVWFELFSHILLVFALGFYLMSNLQLYSYKFERVFFHHAKPSWHFIYLFLPLFAYYLLQEYFWIFFYVAFLPALYLWHRRLDKKLVFTDRVKRFFAILGVLVIFQDFLCLGTNDCVTYGIIMPLLGALIGSFAIEKLLFKAYQKAAKRKLFANKELIVIAITASYGKTSIKNFLYSLLCDDFKTYKTPRSVNTLGGIMKDINEDLPDDAQIYIVEAGARQRGDIKEIIDLIEPHYVIVGQIGTAHLEYFKTLENIRNTKLEAIYSKRLEKAFVHASANIKPYEKVVEFKPELHTKATLEGISFDFENVRYQAPLIGAFNAENIALALSVAKELKKDDFTHRVANLTPVEHRLQKIEANGKIIIDDSYNGNFDGMMESFTLVATYPKRKVLVSAGLIEANDELNAQVAKKADEVFDFVIITAKSNFKIFSENIDNEKLLKLEDKSQMQQILATQTFAGDLILFANDAPNFM
jgi:UDP-N-acetylmuramoyl-tripeptide--D-alanyl-D-alanine ligase